MGTGPGTCREHGASQPLSLSVGSRAAQALQSRGVMPFTACHSPSGWEGHRWRLGFSTAQPDPHQPFGQQPHAGLQQQPWQIPLLIPNPFKALKGFAAAREVPCQLVLGGTRAVLLADVPPKSTNSSQQLNSSHQGSGSIIFLH